MIYQQYSPHKRLSDTVRCYWSLKGNAEGGFNFTVIPDYCIDIIFQSMGNESIIIVGASSEPHRITFCGNFEFFGIRFFPGAFYRLFGVPASELTGMHIGLDDLGAGFKAFSEAQHLYDTEDKIRLLDSLLVKFSSGPSDPISSELLSRAADFSFNHSFLDHYSKKTFNRRLEERVGFNYRKFSNILRIHRSIKLGLEGKVSQADVAYMSGFYDQAHYIRSFKEYTGFTPSRFLKDIKESPVRFIQYPLGIYWYTLSRRLDMKYSSTALFTDNIKGMKEFYTKVMKLEVMMDNKDHVAFVSGLSIWNRGSALSVIFGEEHERPSGQMMELCFDTEDVEGEYKRLKDLVEIINPLQEQPWSQLTFRMYDPDGNILEVAEGIMDTFKRLQNDGLSLEEISERTFTSVEDLKKLLNC